MWVLVGIETDRGPWVAALVAAGYRVFAINPRQVARARERHGTSGAKSDAGDAHTLADLVRTDAHQLRPIAGDSPLVEGIKVIARAHQNLIWDRHRQMLRLRGSLREFFPAALAAWPDLTAPDAVELLAAAPDPERAARLSRSRIAAALRRARRRDVEARAEQIQAMLRGRQLTQPAELAGAYAVTVRAQIALIATLNTQITDLGEQVEAHFGRHPDAEIYRSQPGLGDLLGARVLGEFGDDPDRYDGARARKNYAGSAPITRASGKKTVVLARHVRNHRLADALHQQAFCALRASPGARAYYDRLRRPRRRTTRRPAPARQPPGWHPARLPEDRHPLRRGHRLGTPRQPRSTGCRLTHQLMGCLSATPPCSRSGSPPCCSCPACWPPSDADEAREADGGRWAATGRRCWCCAGSVTAPG